MGKIGDFMQPTELSYPGAPRAGQIQGPGQACGNVPFSPPAREGFFNKWLSPKELPYPVPVCVRPTVQQPAAPSGGQAAGTGSGVLTRVADGVSASGSGSSSGGGASNAAGSSDGGRTGGIPPIVGPVASNVIAPAAPVAPAAPPVTVVLVPLNAASLPASVSAPTVVAPAPVAAVAPAAPVAPNPPVAPVAPAVPVAPTAPIAPAPVAPAAPVPAVTPSAPAAPVAPAPVTPSVPVAATVPAQALSAPVALPVLAPVFDGCGEHVRMQAEPAIYRLDVENPTFTPCYPTAQETYIEDALGEEVSARVVVREVGPFVLRVPEGYDSMDVFYAPVELTPCGSIGDLDQVVTVGDAKITAAYGAELCGALVAGQALYVKIPWRAASWVDMPAGRLSLPVYVRFYSAGAQ